MSGWATLDYPRAQINIRAVSQWEQSFRAHACAKEPWTVAWIEEIPSGGTFWDIGANTGPYALIAAAHGIPTLAFEPGYANYQALCDNVLANVASAQHVAPLAIALSAETKLVSFFYRNLEPGAASHSMGEAKDKMVGNLPALAMRANEVIDRFCGGIVPTHIKIDVDGAELAVLVGFGTQLERVRDIMIEVPNVGPHLDQIHGLLKRAHVLSTVHNQRDGHMIPDVHYERWRLP